jgi:hypothetical protein
VHIGGEGAGAPADGCLIPRDSHARIPCRRGVRKAMAP